MDTEESEYQCSECGADVQSKARVCPNCGARLDDSSDEDEFVEIPVTSDPVNLSSILSLLKENEIEYLINNDAMENIWGANFIQFPRLIVHKDQYEITKEIINSFENKDIKIIDNKIFSDETDSDFQVKESSVEKQLKGVDGWLFFFCLSMILTPIAYLPYNFETYTEVKDAMTWFPFKGILLDVDLIASIIISVLSIYAGYNLWRINDRAVKSANLYLNAFLIYSILYFLIMVFIFSTYNLPFRGLTQQLFGDIFKETVSAATYVVIWKLYLKNSERVKNTYDLHTAVYMNG